jgi:hypothetical protein
LIASLGSVTVNVCAVVVVIVVWVASRFGKLNIRRF